MPIPISFATPSPLAFTIPPRLLPSHLIDVSDPGCTPLCPSLLSARYSYSTIALITVAVPIGAPTLDPSPIWHTGGTVSAMHTTSHHTASLMRRSSRMQKSHCVSESSRYRVYSMVSQSHACSSLYIIMHIPTVHTVVCVCQTYIVYSMASQPA